MKTMMKWIKAMPWPWVAAMAFTLALLDLAFGGGFSPLLYVGAAGGWGAAMAVAKVRGWI